MLSFADDNSQFILPSPSNRPNNPNNNQQPTQSIIQPQSNQTSNININPNPNTNQNQNPTFSKTSSHDLKPHSKL